MYIPRSNRFEDRDGILAFIRRFPFGTLISLQGRRPLATHLPFLARAQGDTICLYAHLALGNPQARILEEAESLAIFMEPQAYISPAHYTSELEVPTWNYIAVHAYGTCEILSDTDARTQLMEDSIGTFEPAYLRQWKRLPEEFRQREMNGIVVFRMLAGELQGKKKLSQNKTPEEQRRIIAALDASAASPERWVAQYMQQRLNDAAGSPAPAEPQP